MSAKSSGERVRKQHTNAEKSELIKGALIECLAPRPAPKPGRSVAPRPRESLAGEAPLAQIRLAMQKRGASYSADEIRKHIVERMAGIVRRTRRGHYGFDPDYLESPPPIRLGPIASAGRSAGGIRRLEILDSDGQLAHAYFPLSKSVIRHQLELLRVLADRDRAGREQGTGIDDCWVTDDQAARLIFNVAEDSPVGAAQLEIVRVARRALEGFEDASGHRVRCIVLAPGGYRGTPLKYRLCAHAPRARASLIAELDRRSVP